MAKFSQNREMRRVLLETGDKILAEASPRDCVWGIGLGSGNPRARDPSNWRGRNLLGKALMRVREIIREEEEKEEEEGQRQEQEGGAADDQLQQGQDQRQKKKHKQKRKQIKKQKQQQREKEGGVRKK